MFYVLLYLANLHARWARRHRTPAMALADDILWAVLLGACIFTLAIVLCLNP